MMLAVVGGAVDQRRLIRDAHEGLVVVHVDEPIPQQLLPEPGMGALARAAPRCEQIPPAVHRHGGPVEQEGAVGGHPLRDLTVDGQLLQILVVPGPDGQPLQPILPGRVLPLPVDILPAGPHDEIRSVLHPIRGAAGMDPLV